MAKQTQQFETAQFVDIFLFHEKLYLVVRLIVACKITYVNKKVIQLGACLCACMCLSDYTQFQSNHYAQF